MRLRYLLAGLLAIVGPVPGQKFEVASIKPSSETSEVNFSTRGGRFVATNLTLQQLISQAYGMRLERIEGGPSWVASDRFDVQAKAEGAMRMIPQEELRPLLQALLQARFQLKVHTILQRASVYALVVAKNGPKVQESTAPSSGFKTLSSGQHVEVQYTKATMDNLARRLTSAVGRPVINKTGLAGEYDFSIAWAGLGASADSPYPSLFTAVQERLGLRLEGEKAEVETLVIDYAAKPSEN